MQANRWDNLTAERRSVRKNAATANWTDERCDILERMWNEGASCRQIAGELGMGVSRSAVIGKAHRMKLSPRVTVHPKTNKRYRGEATKRKPKPTTAFRSGVALPLLPEPLPGDTTILKGDMWKALPDTTPRPLLAVSGDNGCRWPIGEERPYLFCGEPIHKGVYCAAHYAVSYRPLPPKPLKRVRTARGVNIRDFEEA